MNLAWEVTTCDVRTVLNAHLIFKPEEEMCALLTGTLDRNLVERSVLYYTRFDNQCSSAFQEIERQFKEKGVIPADSENFFTMGEDIEDTFDAVFDNVFDEDFNDEEKEDAEDGIED